MWENEIQKYLLHMKYLICVKSRAESLLEVASALQEDVFARVCDLQSANAVLAANLCCHKICIRIYIMKGERLSPIPFSLSEDQEIIDERDSAINENENFDEIKRVWCPTKRDVSQTGLPLE